LLGRAELSRLIAPASVAIVGASATPGAFGNSTLRNIGDAFTGTVYPINPKHPEILGRRTYASIGDLPEVPDCVVLAIPRDHVLPTLRDCAQLGVGGAVVFSSGFGESATPDGLAEQREISDLASRTGMRVCGPNCIGIVNVAASLGLTFMPKLPMKQGPIGVVSQSGALGYVLMQAMERGIGFTHYLSPGNSCDVNVCDFVNYLVDDEATRVIICTLEGIADGGAFRTVCRRALEAGKPLIVCKMGNSEISRRTALSHTGTLAGSSAAYNAMFAETGVIVVDDFEELLETASFFARAGRPAAHGIGVMAVSGGAAVMAADRAAEHGVDLPAPAPATFERLRAVVPAFGSINNPADITAESMKSHAMYGECIAAFAEDPNFAAVVVPMMSASRPTTVERAQYLCDLAATLDKPVCIVWLNEWYEGPGSEIYDASDSLFMFRSMGRCIASLKRWLERDRARERLLAPRAPRLTGDEAAAATLAIIDGAGGRTALSEHDSKAVLAAYGVAVTREKIVADADAAVAAADTIGYPVVLKANSPDILHKTEAGVVKLGIRSAAALREAFASIEAAVAALPDKPAVHGMAVQEMVKPGIEVMVGVRQDAQFGPLVVCGLGGIMVELLQDVSVALAPVDAARAREMLQALKGHRLLAGFRGAAGADIERLADIVVRISELGADLADRISEIDVNPVIAGPARATAVDALIVLHGRDAVQ
jgi:acyl-CoA synthetase (NDP forming)